MSDAIEASGPTVAVVKSGPSMMTLILLLGVTVLTVLGAVGGAAYWLVKSGKLGGQATPATVEAAEKKKPVETRMLVLEPLLVNLADQGGAGYLRVVVALRVEDPPPAKGEKPKEEKPAEKGKPVVNEDEVIMRDAALTVLGRETSERLLAPDGKERLKKELREAFAAQVLKVKVTDVLFSEFLVQR